MAAKDSAQTAGAATPPSRQALFWTTVGYGLMIFGAIGAFFLIRSYGIALVAQPAVAPQTVVEAPHTGGDVFLYVLIALTAVAVLIQTGILVGFYFLSTKLSRQADQAVDATRNLVDPLHKVVDNLQTVSARLADFGAGTHDKLRKLEEWWMRRTA